MTFTILLSLIRRVAEAEAYVKKGLWKAWEPNLFLDKELAGKYFGIIGFVRIGKAVAERSVRRNPGPAGAGQDERSQLGRKASLDPSHPQTDEESPPLQGGVLQALKEGTLRGAALDVTDPEPILSSHPLCHLRNCLIVPHIGSATVECRTLLARTAAENLIRYFS